MVTQFPPLLGSFQTNLMETTASVRRLALLSSHLRPHCLSPQLVFSSTCSSNQENGSCIFCQIVRGEAPAFKVYEDDVCLCMLDANPLCRGHSLIIPKCHFSSLQGTPPSVLAAMFSKAPLISSAIMKATGCGYLVPSPKGSVVLKGSGSYRSLLRVIISFYASRNVYCRNQEYLSLPIKKRKRKKEIMKRKNPTETKIISASSDANYALYSSFLKYADSFNLLVNNGVAAGQVIFHTHIHIIPRRASDCLWTSESLSRRQLKLDQEALKLADRIRDNLPFLNNFEDSKGQGSSLIEN